MKKHTEYGFEILRRQDDIPLLAAHCAFQHHERSDGSGYPRNLKGEEIHPYARIMAVCDVFDALT
ncbi:HD domain-containing protein, partial [Frankia sp. Cpl3]|nr:HD domain-containing protein [Frankia sp. Cpl3]